MKRLIWAALLTLGLGAGAQAASPPSIQLLFETPHFEKAGPGDVIRYSHKRSVSDEKLMGPSYEDTARAEIGKPGEDGKLTSIFVLDEKTRKRQLDIFEGVPGNPLIMVFMEQVSATVQRATGGGSFYIHNRLKESLLSGEMSEPEIKTPDGERKARRALFHAFTKDSNAAKLGPFVTLTLEMTFAPETPGMILSLVAKAEDKAAGKIVYEERYDYTGTEKVK